MFARLSVDADSVRAYGAASSTRADDLRDAAARLSTLSSGSAVFGPVGARFLAALARAADDDARAVTALGGALTATREAAFGSARDYEGADAEAASRVTL